MELNLPVLNTRAVGPENGVKMELHIPGYYTNFPACAEGDLIDIVLTAEKNCVKDFEVSILFLNSLYLKTLGTYGMIFNGHLWNFFF